MRADHTRSEIAALDSQHVDGWASGYPVPRDQREGYTHMIRSMGDPERSARPGRGDYVIAKWKKQHARPTAGFEVEILAYLADGRAQTFNHISVTLYDYTADVAGPNMTKAMWDLVERGEIEHTLHAPIRFRRVRR